MSETIYAQVVAATIARLAAAAEARPKVVVEAIKPDASRVTHYCVACDLSWRGPAPCWSCEAPGMEDRDLAANDRELWKFVNTSSGTFTEGETP